MAEINKLSVGKVLDKLRRNDAPQKSKFEQTAQVWTASWHDRA